MSLIISDETVAELARRLQSVTGAPSVAEAVRTALQHEFERARNARPLRERVASAMALADALGPTDPDFDMKRFRDEESGAA